MPHIHEKIDFTAEVFIVYQDKVLLRIHDKFGIWLSVGGHIEPDEDPNEAAVREAREEVGLDIVLDDSLLPEREPDKTKELIPPYYINRHSITDTHEHVTLVYFGRAMTDRIQQPANHERSPECRWFTQEELKSAPDILPNVRFYALKALEKLSIKRYS